MTFRLDHIGIAVKDLDKSEELFSKLFNIMSGERETIASQGVVSAIFDIGNSKVELLAPNRKDSPLSKYLDNNREGVHHLSFKVDDLNAEIERLSSSGFEFIEKVPVSGAEGKKICFLHPKSTSGVLIELCEER